MLGPFSGRRAKPPRRTGAGVHVRRTTEGRMCTGVELGKVGLVAIAVRIRAASLHDA